jgi:hypothetical protein
MLPVDGSLLCHDWYVCLPFHFLIFHNLIKQIEKRA